MQDPINVVERLKRQVKRNARLAYAEEERRRQELERSLDDTVQALTESRHQVPAPDAIMLASQHAWRLRLELRRRREEQGLANQARVVEDRRTALQQASREARLLELLVEERDVERALVARRAAGRELDSQAMSRWYRS